MKEFGGVWFPDDEIHMIEWCRRNGEMVDGRTSYQIKKYRKAVGYCTTFRTAVDVGGHIGMWSMQMIKEFDFVHAFEPVVAHRECFVQNMLGSRLNVKLHACALGAAPGAVRMTTPEVNSTGSTMIGGEGDIPLETLDSFELQGVDFMKLDCEGSELFALRGGEETIKRCRPVVIVEQKPGRAQRFGLPETGAVQYLEELGYRMAECLSGDYIMAPA